MGGQAGSETNYFVQQMIPEVAVFHSEPTLISTSH